MTTVTEQPRVPDALGVRIRSWVERTHGRPLSGVAWLFLTRMATIFVILFAYSWFRKTYFQQTAAEAFANALDIIDLQARLGIAVTDVEIPMQRWVLERPSLIDFFNAYYRQFKLVLYVCAALCLILAPVNFARVFRVFLLATAIALPWYALYPLAPPRLMGPYGLEFVDTLAVYGGVQSSASGAGGANQFAAMPSMHIGWTTVAALWIAGAIRWKGLGAIIGVIHLSLMCVTVVVTGNHYVLDIVGGFIVAGAAIVAARLLPPIPPFMPAWTIGKRQARWCP